VYQSSVSSSSSPTWDNSTLITALNNLVLQQGGWVMDSGVSSHMTNDDGNISHSALLSTPHFVTVGNGNSVPISSSGHSSLRTPSGHVFKLNNVLLVPNLIRNLLSICKFTCDNFYSIEFDAFGFSVKDLKTRRVILRCNSEGDLYTFPSSIPARWLSSTAMVTTASAKLWHRRLGQSRHDAMLSLQCLALIKCIRTVALMFVVHVSSASMSVYHSVSLLPCLELCLI
jgi:hypothetical protein